MRTVFITPLLFKKLDRPALRRGESGQAIVLIALVAIGLVAMVGLAIDSGIGYLDATKLQRAADSAALAGVIWLPDNRAVGDARAQLAAEANGVKVACYYNSGLAATDPYNQRCKRASYTNVLQNGPEQLYSFDSQVPSGIAIQYKVTLSKMESRFFLGVLGIPAYSIVRTSTAQYFQRVRFGSSFNYYGSSGVATDHYMRCDTTSLVNCSGTSTSQLIMRGATYQKYILMRCDQPSPPSPCIGNFWANIAGQDVFHGNGDAYNPIRDGAKVLGANSGSVSGYTVSGESNTEYDSQSSDCNHLSNTSTWFVDEIFATNGGSCPAVDSSGKAIQNLDSHPDSPDGKKGFGSEVIIDVDPKAIYSYSETSASLVNHTNLNVTIYDGAMNEHGINTNYGVSDSYNISDSNANASILPYSGSTATNSLLTYNSGANTLWPYQSNWSFQNVTLNTSLLNSSAWSTKRLICSPGTTSLNGQTSPSGKAYNTSYCDSASPSSPSKPTTPRATDSDPSVPGDISTAFPDRNNLELTYNDVRTRYTLYGPPPTPAIPPIYSNVQPYLIGSMEMTDMSAQARTVQYPIGCPQTGCPYYGNTANPLNNSDPTNRVFESRRFCYFIFDDTKSFWDNTQFSDTYKSGTATLAKKPPSQGTTAAPYFGPDFAYSTQPVTGTIATEGTLRSANNRYAYVCPANPTTGTDDDLRWNSIKGTPTARYGSMVNFDSTNPNDRTIDAPILDPAYTNDISANPIVGQTLITTTAANQVVATASSAIYSVADPEAKSANIWDVSSTSATGFQQVVDPQQDCRQSAVDMSPSTTIAGYPMDSMWGHNRIPFNLAYGDPLVNRAWITTTTGINTGISTPVASKLIAGYYTIYYSFHGWRCDWDFDSNYTYDASAGRGNPLKNPALMPSATNPSLSLQERLTWGNTAGNYGKFDKAFVEGHPGLDSVDYTSKVLLTEVPSANSCNAYRDFPAYTFTKSGTTCTATTNKSGFTRDFGLQPYFHMTNVAWVSGTIGLAPGFSDANAPVRGGSYMLHIQTFSGASANQYAVKAEYENPKIVTYTLSSGTLSVTPVPSVYPLTSMSIFANNGNANTTQSVIFDLAFIPPVYANTQAIVQLWDPGDLNAGSLSVSILKPSTYGPRVKTTGATPSSWTVPLGAAITTTISACPMTISPVTAGTKYPCVFNSATSPATNQTFTDSGTQYYNDQWVFLSFQIPSLAEFNTWKANCETNGVPENLCYYFQINYQLTNAKPTDVTTWQLLVQGQPVTLVDND